MNMRKSFFTDKAKIMITTPISKMENVWKPFQEPYCSACVPNSAIRLFSALDQGWKILKIELAPSWDQYGFFYLVTFKHPAHPKSQEMILPLNSQVTDLLQKSKAAVTSIQPGTFQITRAGKLPSHRGIPE
jgi:hypothetical protein